MDLNELLLLTTKIIIEKIIDWILKNIHGKCKNK